MKKPVMSLDEQIALNARWRAGDAEARNQLVRATDGLVHSVVRSSLPAGAASPDYEDYVQEGRIGLLRALRDWNPEKGALTTYASWWIRAAVIKALHRGTVVSVPIKVRRATQDWGSGSGVELDNEFERNASPSPSPEAQAADREKRQVLNLALARMKKRDRDIIRRRFRDEQTLTEIAGDYGLSRERVRQIEGRAVTELKRAVTRRR